MAIGAAAVGLGMFELTTSDVPHTASPAHAGAPSLHARKTAVDSTAPLPDATVCTPAQMIKMYADLPVECAPPDVTQIPRPADQTFDLGSITDPAGRQLHAVATVHMVWNGIPGHVTLSPGQRASYLQAAQPNANATTAACCDTSFGPTYNDSVWHCGSRNITVHYLSSGENPTWDFNTFESECAIPHSIYGGVVENYAPRQGGPVSGAPAAVASCTGYLSEGNAQACYGPMGEIHTYPAQLSGEASAYGGFIVRASNNVEFQFSPTFGTYCFPGWINMETHFHSNFGGAYESDHYLSGSQVACYPPLHTVT